MIPPKSEKLFAERKGVRGLETCGNPGVYNHHAVFTHTLTTEDSYNKTT
jgi:hypothetical protein